MLLAILLPLTAVTLPLSQISLTQALHYLIRDVNSAATDYQTWAGQYLVWVEIKGTITDAQTGRPVVADVHAANVHLDDVTEFRLVFPASEEEITLTVTAPGYQEWSVGIKPHISHSKVFTTPIKLQRKPAGDQT